ncbi:MAG: metallophosphoesterase family protein [Desulfurococcaceae archaeon]
MNNMKLNPELEKLNQEAVLISQSYDLYRKLLEESIDTVRKNPVNSLFIDNVIELHYNGNFIFIGDIHGDYYTLLDVMNRIWGLLENSIFIFLGDYIDRGYMQVETLAFLLKLKNTYQDRVILLRGNHEPPRWLIPHPHDYPLELRSRFSTSGESLYELSINLFDNLPLVAYKKNHFIALHGGPPLRVLRANSFHEAFTAGASEDCRDIVEDVLWSDPVDTDIEYSTSPRGAGVLYGPSITNKALEFIEGRFIVRGHEAVNGVRVSHNGRVITIFTSPIVYGLKCGGLLFYEYRESLNEYEMIKLCYNLLSKEMLIFNNSLKNRDLRLGFKHAGTI